MNIFERYCEAADREQWRPSTMRCMFDAGLCVYALCLCLGCVLRIGKCLKTKIIEANK